MSCPVFSHYVYRNWKWIYELAYSPLFVFVSLSLSLFLSLSLSLSEYSRLTLVISWLYITILLSETRTYLTLCWGASLSTVASDTSQLIIGPFRCFTYLTAHSPTLPLLHLRHSSFSNPSFVSPTSLALHLRHLVSRPCSQHIPVSNQSFSRSII